MTAHSGTDPTVILRCTKPHVRVPIRPLMQMTDTKFTPEQATKAQK